MKGKVDDMKKSKTNVFRILSVILMLVMVVSAVNGNTVSAKMVKPKTDKKKNVVVLYFSATGTTKGAAQRIKKATKGKMISIKAADPYTEAGLGYGDDESLVTKEHESADSPAKSSVRPKISNLKSIKKAVKKRMSCISVTLIWSKVLIVYCVYSVCKMGEIGTVCTKW